MVQSEGGITIEVNVAEGPSKDIYPRLVKHKISGVIVLLEGRGRGTVMFSPVDSKTLRAGYMGECWDMDKFENFNGSVTLTNK